MAKQRRINAGHGSVVVGGNVERSNIILGDGNVVSAQSARLESLFDAVHRAVDKAARLSPLEKADVKAELREIQTALETPQPDEGFLTRRFRSLKRMAPDIVEVAFETLKNPIGGAAEVIKRVAKKMAEEAGDTQRS